MKMDKESLILLQKLDCNCNDCKFMNRDNEKYNESVKFHHKMQLDYFTTIKQKKIDKANWWKDKGGDIKKHDYLKKEANEMKFQFDKKVAMISFGHCAKLNKAVTFLPNTFQFETQNCFEHRR